VVERGVQVQDAVVGLQHVGDNISDSDSEEVDLLSGFLAAAGSGKSGTLPGKAATKIGGKTESLLTEDLTDQLADILEEEGILNQAECFDMLVEDDFLEEDGNRSCKAYLNPSWGHRCANHEVGDTTGWIYV
jgi:hypothetical protein